MTETGKSENFNRLGKLLNESNIDACPINSFQNKAWHIVFGQKQQTKNTRREIARDLPTTLPAATTVTVSLKAAINLLMKEDLSSQLSHQPPTNIEPRAVTPPSNPHNQQHTHTHFAGLPSERATMLSSCPLSSYAPLSHPHFQSNRPPIDLRQMTSPIDKASLSVIIVCAPVAPTLSIESTANRSSANGLPNRQGKHTVH